MLKADTVSKVPKYTFASIFCGKYLLPPPCFVFSTLSPSLFNFQLSGSIPQPCSPPPAPPSSSPSHSPSPSNPPSLPSNFLHTSGFNKIQTFSILSTLHFSQLFSPYSIFRLLNTMFSTHFQIVLDSVD